MKLISLLAGALAAFAVPAFSQVLVIRDVTVIPADTNEVLPHRTVTVRDGRIERIDEVGEASNEAAPVPDKATRVDGRGKFLVPGFVDTHVHISTQAGVAASRDPQMAALRFGPGQSFDRAVLLGFLRAGVTTAVNLGGGEVGDRELLRLREEIAQGRMLGPRLLVAKRINGPIKAVTEADLATAPPSSINAPTHAADGVAAVQRAKQLGYDLIKPYQYLNRETYAAIVDTARQAGLVTTGHLPELGCSVCADRAFVFAHPMDNIAHAEELQRYARETDLAPRDIDALSDLVLQSRAGVSVGLVTMKAIQHLQVAREVMPVPAPWARFIDPVSALEWRPPLNRYLTEAFRQREGAALFSASYDYARVLTRQLWKKGVPLTVGTDASLPGLVYGYSTLQEMIELGEAGLPPIDVLRAASINAHKVFDAAGGSGAVRVGERADLVLLEADPVADLQNITRIHGVVTRGVWLPSALMDELLGDLQRRSIIQAP